jgi:CDP-2,3-bis-(O-geranylgeranyl)-sn-glycerol synthase
MPIPIEDLVLKGAVAIYSFLPAYLANASAMAFGGGRPIDGGRLFADGKPIFGSHKTVRGAIAGAIVGPLVGIIQGEAALGLLMGMGAILGDLAGAFLKRRLSLQPGSPFPVLDQFDFLLMAYLFSSPLLQLPPSSILLVFICTPAIHVVSNYFSCLLGLKEVPW